MHHSKELKELFKAILSLENEQECYDFFEDLCTIKEIEQMTQRYAAAKLLNEGKTYEEVIEMTEISSATLSRVSKCIKYGKGYKNIINKQK
ncbi:MAG: hypothetical protein IKD36_01970 [Clostridia bacterium]|nr:hypothetical protein [Clostridia bacterium]